MHACVRACVRACMHACMHACILACVRACVHACTLVNLHLFHFFFLSPSFSLFLPPSLSLSPFLSLDEPCNNWNLKIFRWRPSTSSWLVAMSRQRPSNDGLDARNIKLSSTRDDHLVRNSTSFSV